MLISSIQSLIVFFFISLEVLSSALPILTGRAFLWYLQCKYTVSIFSCSRFYSFDSLLCSLHPPPPFFLQGAFLLTTIKDHQPWFSFFWGLFPLYFKKPFYDKITRFSIFFRVILLMLLQSTIYKGYYVKHSRACCILQNNMLLPLSFFKFIFIAGKYVLCIFFF